MTANKKILGIMMGSQAQIDVKDKAVIDINCGMLFKTKVGTSFLTVQSDPRSRQNLSGLPFLSSFPSGVFLLCRCFLSSSLLSGQLAESGIDGNAFINRQALAFQLAQDFGVKLIHGFFGQSLSKTRECGVVRGRFA